VSLFVVSPESEDRNAVEVDNWASTNRASTLNTIFYAAVVAIGILSGRLACGNGNEKTLVLQWTNKKSKARKNKLIVANQVLLFVLLFVIKQKVLRKYLKNAKMC
jgi:hypothetical protein